MDYYIFTKLRFSDRLKIVFNHKTYSSLILFRGGGVDFIGILLIVLGLSLPYFHYQRRILSKFLKEKNIKQQYLTVIPSKNNIYKL